MYRGTQITHVYYEFIKDDEDKRLQLGFAEMDVLTGQASEEAVNLYNDRTDRVFRAACLVSLRELQLAVEALLKSPVLPMSKDFYLPKDPGNLYPYSNQITDKRRLSDNWLIHEETL